MAPIEFRGHNLQVIGNAALSSISFVPLPGGNELSVLVISDNPVLTSAPSLATVTGVGFLDIERNPMLGSLFGPGLTSAGSMAIDDNASLTSLQFPHLESGMFGLGMFDVSRNASLTTLELPALSGAAEQLLILLNPRLHHIAFDALAHSGKFQVTDNPLLPSCEVRAVFAHVTSTSQSQSGNDDAAICTP